MTERLLEAASADETRAIGADLATHLRGGDVVLLRGDLGAGKTTLTQGIGRGLGVTDRVQSPTFTLIAEYRAPSLGPSGQLVHVDLYRLEGASDLASIGLEEYLDRADCVVVIEWPDRADVSAFPPHWSVELAIVGEHSRTLTIQEPADD